MAFTFQDIFGVNALFNSGDDGYTIVTLSKYTFVDVDLSGELPVGVGLSNEYSSPTATQMLYGILMILKQNQGETVNTDPTQKVYIADAGKRLATGTRSGQIQQSFTISFFVNSGITTLPSLDQLEPQQS